MLDLHHPYALLLTDMPIIQPDNPIPDMTLSTFTGGSISLLSHAGRPS